MRTKDQQLALIETLQPELENMFPYVHIGLTSLSTPQRSNICISVSAQPREEWSNGIKQNSPYCNVFLWSEGKIELQNGSIRGLKFRKQAYTEGNALRKLEILRDRIFQLV
jgi:hypothetical protein